MIGFETSSPEREAILAGTLAGEIALKRAQGGVLQLFGRAGYSGNADPQLDVLRAYAELRRALQSRGRVVPATSLLNAGFTARQIAGFDAVIMARWPDC